jgi:DNA helicase-2/ATP-dependent DNA helicase PcrA
MLTATAFDLKIEQLTRNTGKTPTIHQQAIYHWVLEDEGNLIVNAVAGSGKTTTIVDLLSFVPTTKRATIVAFNKHIAEELNSRKLPSNAKACTLHSLGFGVVRANVRGRVNLDNNKSEAIAKWIFAGKSQRPLKGEEAATFARLVPAVKNIISKFKAFGHGVLRDHATEGEVLELAARYGIELPDNGDWQPFLALLEETYRVSLEVNVIDFDDMLLLPLAYKWSIPTSDFALVDESQDLNPVQVAIVKQMVRNNGRAIFVGDRNQAIYGFRGADPEAMDNVKRDFNATELPLSISWRCPKLVVAQAQAIVPQIEAAPNAAEGITGNITEDVFSSRVAKGDYVLCRTTAPLVRGCMEMIREGRKATVKGRDIGANLATLMQKIARKGLPGDVTEQIEAYHGTEAAKLTGKASNEAKLMALQDKCDTLRVLAEGEKTVADVIAKINKIFSDDEPGITFCTVHRSKGLEAKRIFILHPELMPHPLARQDWQIQQEHNLRYVAVTRSLAELWWVH